MKLKDYLAERFHEVGLRVTYRRFKHQAQLYDWRRGIVDLMAHRNLKKAVRLGLRYVLDAPTVSDSDKKLLEKLIMDLNNQNLSSILSEIRTY